MTKCTSLLTLILAMLATPAPADVCLSNAGRIRVRPDACHAWLGEQRFALATAIGGGTRTLAVVDANGALVGYVVGLTRGYELTYPEVLVMRSTDVATIGLPVNARGLVPPGSDVLYFTEADCTGTPLIPSYGDQRNELLRVGPVWRDVAWFPSGEPSTATAQSYLIPPLSTYFCGDYNGFIQPDGFCCVPADLATGEWFAAERFDLNAAGLAPPFRLSMEP